MTVKFKYNFLTLCLNHLRFSAVCNWKCTDFDESSWHSGTRLTTFYLFNNSQTTSFALQPAPEDRWGACAGPQASVKFESFPPVTRCPWRPVWCSLLTRWMNESLPKHLQSTFQMPTKWIFREYLSLYLQIQTIYIYIYIYIYIFVYIYMYIYIYIVYEDDKTELYSNISNPWCIKLFFFIIL